MDTKVDSLYFETIGCAYEVFNYFRYGFLESIYQKAMALELKNRNIKYQIEHPLNVYYKDSLIGQFRADLFIDNKLVVELKSVEKIKPVHVVQLRHYLKVSKSNYGLLLNFAPDGVKTVRICLE